MSSCRFGCCGFAAAAAAPPLAADAPADDEAGLRCGALPEERDPAEAWDASRSAEGPPGPDPPASAAPSGRCAEGPPEGCWRWPCGSKPDADTPPMRMDTTRAPTGRSSVAVKAEAGGSTTEAPPSFFPADPPDAADAEAAPLFAAAAAAAAARISCLRSIVNLTSASRSRMRRFASST